MKQLKKQFIGIGEVKGFKFTQIYHANRAFLYEINTGGSIYYEVFKKVKNRRFACVSYPSSDHFGIWAWTYLSYDEAKGRFDQLNQLKK